MKNFHLKIFPKTQEVPMLQFRDQDGTFIDERPLDRGEIERFSKEIDEEYGKVAPVLPSLGRALYSWVDGPTQRWLERVAHDPEGLSLHIDVEERLRHLPWELMASGYSYLCASQLQPFTPVRRVTSNTRSNEIFNRPLRVLFMATSPEQVHPELNFEEEEGMILRATRDPGIELIVEESGTLDGLEYLVKSFERGYFDVVHLSGHADVTKDGPSFVMENNLGLRQDATAEEIARAFVGMWPRLVFLSGCKTGQSPDQGGIPSMSEALVSAGAPAVLGWALPVGDIAASVLSSRLYSLLATGTPIDEAVARARQHLFESNNPNWHLLRLYSDATPLSEMVTRPQSPGRVPVTGRRASEDFLDALGKSKVASRETFVGRRRQIQRCLTAISRPDSSGKTDEALLLHGMGGLGKSTLAARLCERMDATHRRAVWLGKINEQEILSLTRKVTLPDIETDKKANAILNDPGVDLQTRLRFLLSGPLATIPCLFVFDDFENGNLEPSASGGYVASPEALDVLSAFLGAIRSANSRSRVIITSRFEFPLPTGYNVHREGLESMRGAELEKKLQLSSALRIDSDTPQKLKEQAIATSAGNPRLLEWLDRVLLDPDTDHDSILRVMDATTAEFRENVLAEKLLESQTKALRRLLALVGVFELPVAREAVQAVAGEIPVEPNLNRAVSLGLMESGINPISGEPRYLVSNILQPLITKEISEEERKAAYREGARSLYELWVTGGSIAH